jgi:hypothetical protein
MPNDYNKKQGKNYSLLSSFLLLLTPNWQIGDEYGQEGLVELQRLPHRDQ